MEQLKIETIEDAKYFFNLLHVHYKVAFHPDDDFRDYVNIDTSLPTFKLEEAHYFNALMDLSFSVCQKEGVDIYEVGMSV